MDSSGLRSLLRLAEQADREGRRFTIRRELTPPVERLLDLTGAAERLPFAD
jgi:anti-anti-sigma regulatory factor